MMAVAGQESHGIAKKELQPPLAASNPEDGETRSSAKTHGESDVGDVSARVGAAGSDACVGHVGALFEARLKQPRDQKGKKASKRGGQNSPPGDYATVTSAAPSLPAASSGGAAEMLQATNIVAASAGEELEGGRGASAALTRQRTQQMYEAHRQIQEKLRAMRDISATSGCTFSPKLASKQKARKSEEGLPPDHLYKDFQKQLEKKKRLVEDEEKKLSFRPVLPTASSRLAAKLAMNTPVEGRHKSAEDKSKATAEAMYKECTFTPDTAVTKAISGKLLTGKGKQAPAADRLYASAEAQAAIAKSREETKAAKELGGCTFRPDTSVSRSKRSSSGSGQADSSSNNAHERLFEGHGKVLMKMQTKREELATKELAECTFSPALVTKAKKCATKPPAGAAEGCDGGGGEGDKKTEPVHERLYSKRGRTKTREGFVDPECTFQPNLCRKKKSPLSAPHRRKTEDSGGGADRKEGASRLEVMYTEGKLRQKARSQSPRNYTAKFLEQDEAKEMELCTFQPNVSSTKNSRFKGSPRAGHIFEGLYARREDRVEARERILQEDMRACTFSPELSSQKTRIGRSMSPQRQRPVYDELYEEAAAQRVARTKSAQNLQSRECPFKPQLATRPRNSLIHGGVGGGGRGKDGDSSGKAQSSATFVTDTTPLRKPQALPGRPQESRRVGGGSGAASGGRDGAADAPPLPSMLWDEIPTTVCAANAAAAAAAAAAANGYVSSGGDDFGASFTPPPAGNVAAAAAPESQATAATDAAAADVGTSTPAAGKKEAQSSTSGGSESTADLPLPPLPALDGQDRDGNREDNTKEKGGTEVGDGAEEEYDY